MNMFRNILIQMGFEEMPTQVSQPFLFLHPSLPYTSQAILHGSSLIATFEECGSGMTTSYMSSAYFAFDLTVLAAMG